MPEEASEFERDRKRLEAEGMKKLKRHIDEDLEYYRSLKKHHDEAHVIETLRIEYVRRAAGAETLFPLKRLVIFNTWYPQKKAL